MFDPRYIRQLANLKRCFFKRGPPLYMLFHVTHRCPAQCRHCFVTDQRRRIGPGEELTLAEIERFVKTMDGLLWLNICGGEPFVRDDVPEIIELFHRLNKVRIFKIDSNGFFTERTIRHAEKLARLTPDAQTTINLSIDGIGRKHDDIRNCPGLFEKVTHTYRGLAGVARKYPNLRVSVEVTASKFNQDDLQDIFNYFVNELKPANFNPVFCRGVAREPEATDVDVRHYAEFSARLDELAYHRGTGFALFPYASIINAKNILARRLIVRIASERRYLFPCTANFLNATLYSNGDLVSCELKGSVIGNLRDYDYDFKRLWRCEKAEQVRNEIRKSRCFCTHECYLNTAILFNPRLLPALLKEAVKINALRLLHRMSKTA